MRKRQIGIAAAIAGLLLLSGFLLWEAAVGSRSLHERDQARRRAALALTERDPERAAEIFRLVSSFDPGYAPCEEGRTLSERGHFAEAAESFRACRDHDPVLLAAHLAWAEAVLRSQTKSVYPEIRAHLLDVLEASPTPSSDPVTSGSVQSLILELEELIAADAPREHDGPWALGELVEVLSRSHSRGASRYEGPRVPLRLGFRPGDATLGSAARAQLQEVARALRTGRLARTVLEVEGHTDGVEAPTEAARTSLGLRRAVVVGNFLVSSGIPRERLRVTSLGGRYPLAANDSLAGRDANRRVELFSLDDGSPVWRDVRE